MTKVFLIHGFEGTPNGGWRPWLMGELEKLEIYACALPMPNPAEPKVQEWVAEIARAVDMSQGDDVYLVGHSLGAPGILRYLESDHAKQISGAVLVAGPAGIVGTIPKLDDFLKKPFDFENICARCKQFAVIHGDDDMSVPVAHAHELGEALSVTPTIIPHGEHLNGSAGWTQLPEVLKVLVDMIS